MLNKPAFLTIPAARGCKCPNWDSGSCNALKEGKNTERLSGVPTDSNYRFPVPHVCTARNFGNETAVEFKPLSLIVSLVTS
jgi:hypothetical protein